MKKQIKILQDDREPELQLLVDINNLGIEFVKERLRVGDYVYNNLLIERKTIDDFANSILDKRLETQVEKMKQSKKLCFIIVIGSIKDRKSEINENCILGKMVSLVFKHNIKMLFVDDDLQFCYVLRNLVKKYEILKGGQNEN